MSDDNKMRLLEEKILRLERQMAAIRRSRQGLSVEPALNTLGQDTNIKGNLNITGLYLVNGSPFDGWISDTDTWVYVSATSFKIVGKDVASRFPVGTKIKLTQTTVKYFYVVSAAFATDTTVTITGGSDYTLANAAITNPNYSYVATPQGFPHWFNYAMAWTSYQTPQPAIGNGIISAKFNIIQRTLKIEAVIQMGSTTTYGTNLWFFGYPFNIGTYTIGGTPGFAYGWDNSAVSRIYGLLIFSSSSQMVIQTLNSASVWFSSTAPFTWAADDALWLKIDLRI